MKGVINKGIEDLVTTKFGIDAWEKVKSIAKCDEPFFATSATYPDESTISLIQAASEVCGLTPETIMIEYGRYIVPKTLKESYPTYYALAGSSSRDFIRNLSKVHDVATKNISGAAPPEFEFEDLPSGAMMMYYRSSRKLCSILKGLVLGVGDLFNEKLKVRETTCMHNGDEKCSVEIIFP